MHLSVTKDQMLTVVDAKGRAKQVTVAEAAGFQKIFDWFGNIRSVEVSRDPVKEKLSMLACTSGEPVIVGESHTVLCRVPRQGRWKRVPLSEITEPVLVQLPQRKIFVSPKLFDVFSIDDKGLYLEPTQASDMLDLMRKASWCGLTVSRRKAELRIDLEKHRPSCYAAKLINGGMEYDLEKTLGGLVGGGIVSPKRLFDDDYLKEVKGKGILMEGAAVMNSAPLLPPRPLAKEGDVYHIRVDDPMTPVETSWCHF